MKDDIFAAVLVVIFSISFGVFIGWLFAHATVAHECRKLESFYVGNSVFVCKEK